MKMNILLFAGLALFSCLLMSCQQQASQDPPTAKVQNVVDEFYGVKVDDPYRYMENLEDPEVKSWIKGQAEYAAGVLGKIPGRDAIYKRLEELDAGKPYQLWGFNRLKDGTMFYMKRSIGENLPKLYVRLAKSNEEKLLIDSETMTSADGQHYSIGYSTPSPDGRYIAYGLAKGGSEETVLHILNAQSGKNLPETIDRIENAYNSPQWLPDGSGFFYCRRQQLPAGATETEVYKKTKAYFHKLNTDINKDILVMGCDLSKLNELIDVDFPSISIPVNSDYAVAKIKHGDSKELTIYTAPIKKLLKGSIPWVKVCSVNDEVIGFRVHNNNIYLQTAKDAPRFKVVRTSLVNPDFSKAEVVIDKSEKVVDGITIAKDALYVSMNDGGIKRIVGLKFGKGAKPVQLELPDNAGGHIVSSSQHFSDIYISTNSWTKGSLIYKYDPQTGKYTDSGLLPKGKYDDVPGYASTEVKVKSHDGVMVPLSIIHKSDIKLDGSNPTLIKGYGAYGSTSNASFDPLKIAWLERGGVIAVAHVRGGGAYGKEWHRAGRMLTKPNTWKDFIACAEYLIDKGYTSRKLIAGQGGSAGGILIGRAITERPDLFTAAIIAVGCLDAIRMETTTNGVPNIQEFGTVTNEDGFKGLYEMSSYIHVKDGVSYPAILLTHGINDPRVNPWMSAKMTARLQAASTSGKPILFRVTYGAGHGIGSTRNQRLEETADKWAFLLWQFGLDI
ncbi:MAG: prolyl oligopeptidase family serine peptidase [Candidatus Hatepunaea meridiana]|nr:prolyl oligopeptidase family serine peptidase [Candidatus Hatepunaea meridiana]